MWKWWIKLSLFSCSFLGPREIEDNSYAIFFWRRGGGGGGRGLSIMFYVKMVIVYHCYKKKKENPVGKKGNTTFWVVVAENFWEQRNIWKGSPVLSGRNIPIGNSCCLSSKPSLKPVSGLRSRFFSINGTYCTNGKGDFGTKFTSPEFCARFTRQTVARPVFFFCRPK